MITEILLLILLFFLIWLKTKKPSSMPPGSFGLPVLGTLPSKRISITDHMLQLQKKYGNIFTTKWGSFPMVVILDFNLMKKAFQHPDLQGRPPFLYFQVLMRHKNRGVLFSNGNVWAQNRRFVLHHLRNLGMGKTVLESAMQNEAKLLVEYLGKKFAGKPSVMDLAINGAVVNVLWQMLASRRFDINDPNSIKYMAHTQGLVEAATTLFLLDIFPILRQILPTFIKDKFMKLGESERHAAEIHAMARVIIEEHIKNFDPENPRDLIDQFILQNGEPGSGYSLKDEEVKNLSSIMADLYNAGSETTSSTIRWMILYMATHPSIQAKVHKCLDDVVPSSRLPGLGDRSQLQYVDAMLLEVMRLSSLVHIGLPHQASSDTQFEGYLIPKGTIITGCIRACQLNDNNWENANEFNPDRFLDENGMLKTKQENFLPFSLGRRQCLGESLARMELFLFAAAILQRFKIDPPPNVTLSLKVDPGQLIVNQPLPYEVVLTRRN